MIVRAAGGMQQFIQLDMDLVRVSVLSVLDQKDHQEGNNCRAGIDDQLPGVVKAPQGAAGRPYGYAGNGERKGRGAAGFVGKPLGCAFKYSFLGHLCTMSVMTIIY